MFKIELLKTNKRLQQEITELKDKLIEAQNIALMYASLYTKLRKEKLNRAKKDLKPKEVIGGKKNDKN